MFATVAKKLLDPQPPPEQIDAPTEYIEITREPKARLIPIEAAKDALLTPLEIQQKYTKTFTFHSKAFTDRVFAFFITLKDFESNATYAGYMTIPTLKNDLAFFAVNKTTKVVTGVDLLNDLDMDERNFVDRILRWVYEF